MDTDLLHKQLNDKRRLAALSKTALLDTPSEEAFDRLSRLAKGFTASPIALVSLVEAERQFFKSCIGLPEPWSGMRATPISHSFCRYNLDTGNPLIIRDAREHPVLKDNRAITELSFIAYLGIPLVTKDGYVLGAFCVIDTKPRSWTREEIGIVKDLAAAVMTEIELRTEIKDRKTLSNKLAFANDMIKFSVTAMFTCDADGNMIYGNPAFIKIWGFESSAEFVGKSFWHYFQVEDNLGDISANLETSGKWEDDCIAVKKNGSTFQVHVTAATIQNNENKSIAITASAAITDSVTDEFSLKQAEAKRKESDERFRAVFDDANDGILVCDIKTKQFTMANNIVCDMLGYTIEELLGLSAYDIYQKEGHCEMIDIFEMQAQKKLRVAENVPVKQKDGSVFYADVNARPLTIGTADLLVCSVRDITDRKAMAEALSESEKRLRQAQKMEAVGTLAGGIAHDFNNILGIILGNSEFVLSRLPSENPSFEALKDVKEASLRAKDVITQLLTLCHKLEDKSVPLRAGQTVLDAIKLVRSVIPRTVYIQHTIDCYNEKIIADPTHINQVLINLCKYAAETMNDGKGIITIDIKNCYIDAELAEKHNQIKQGHYVELKVRDNGQGIASEQIHAIFEPGFAAKNINSNKGTGLGLSVAYGIITRLGGDIVVDSTVGKGTVYTILIPATDIEIIEEIDISESILKGSERILFIDDEELMNKLEKRVLTSFGYQVDTQTSPEKAIEVFKNNPDYYDLVITAMAMPGITGLEITETLIGIRSDIPVILCAGQSDPVDEKIAKVSGVKTLLSKPIDQSTLFQVIQSVLEKGKNKIPS